MRRTFDGMIDFVAHLAGGEEECKPAPAPEPVSDAPSEGECELADEIENRAGKRDPQAIYPRKVYDTTLRRWATQVRALAAGMAKAERYRQDEVDAGNRMENDYLDQLRDERQAREAAEARVANAERAVERIGVRLDEKEAALAAWEEWAKPLFADGGIPDTLRIRAEYWKEAGMAETPARFCAAANAIAAGPPERPGSETKEGDDE